MMWQRILFGALMILAVVGVVLLDGWLSAAGLIPTGDGTGTVHVKTKLMCGIALTLALAILVMFSVFEMGRLCREGGYQPATSWAAFASVLLMLAPWAEMQQRLAVSESGTGLAATVPLSILIVTGGLLGACLIVLARKATERAVANIGTTVLLILYLGLLGSFVVRLRCLWPGPAGATAVVYFILTVKAGDIGAYFVGKLFGKNKLAPWVSPGKTIEGFVGAVLLALVAACGLLAVWGRFGDHLGPKPFTWSQALAFGPLMAVCGHLGDLVESLAKRDVGTKDSGRLVPSFGGFLDIVDSPLFAAPVAWWMLTFWNRIG